MTPCFPLRNPEMVRCGLAAQPAWANQGWAGCELRRTNGLTGGEVIDIEQAPDDRIWFRTRGWPVLLRRTAVRVRARRFEIQLWQNTTARRGARRNGGSCQRIMANSRWNGREMQAVATGIIRTNDWIDALHFDRQGRLWFQLADRGGDALKGTGPKSWRMEDSPGRGATPPPP